jgi:hypothetical protein
MESSLQTSKKTLIENKKLMLFVWSKNGWETFLDQTISLLRNNFLQILPQKIFKFKKKGTPNSNHI